MKKTLFVTVALLGTLWATAQNVGINQTGAAPAASAMLDVVSTNRGLLIPRVALTATNAAGPIAAPANSLLVFNTATAGVAPNNVIPGYYYWNGAAWVRFMMGNGDAWVTAGNAGTNPTNNFIGTTDNQAFVIRTNNVERMRVVANGQVGVNGAPPNAFPKFISQGNAANPDGLQGSTIGNGIGVFGLRMAGSTGTWGSVQGELIATLPNNSNGVSGLVNNTNHRGVTGQKPVGGLQWGGLFLNDLGYTGFFGAASDERFKKNVVRIENALEDLMKLKTYKYHYTEPELGGDHVFYYGFMAQEIEQIFPDFVQEKDFTPSQARTFYNGHDKNLKIKAVSTISLIPVLTQAIQEQQEIIESLEQRIERLEKLLEQK
ncbi:MAG: tail fiber domain-containing protein [Flavobacteriales bacterium]